MTTTNEGTQRDELAEIVYLSAYPDPTSKGIQPLSERSKWEQSRNCRTADDILAAGYRKPRTVESPQDLDGLPFGSVVLDCYEVAWTCSRRRVDGTLSEWLCTEFSELVDSHYVLQHGPVTVLHSPEATA